MFIPFATDMVNDIAKVGTMFLVSRWLSGNSLTDRTWLMLTLHTLLGFATYHLVSRVFIDTSGYGEYTPLLNDILQFSTMLLIVRLLGGNNPFDITWLYFVVVTAIGLAIYDIFVSKRIRGTDYTPYPKLADTINDWVKFGLLELVRQLLMGGSIVDQSWGHTTVDQLLGFTAYNLGFSYVLEFIKSKIPLTLPMPEQKEQKEQKEQEKKEEEQEKKKKHRVQPSQDTFESFGSYF